MVNTLPEERLKYDHKTLNRGVSGLISGHHTVEVEVREVMFADRPIPSADKTSPGEPLDSLLLLDLQSHSGGMDGYGHQEGQWAPGGTPSQTTLGIMVSLFLPPAGVLTHLLLGVPLTLTTYRPLGGSTILSESLHH